MDSQSINASIADLTLVLHQLVKRERQRGFQLPEDIAASWKRLSDSLLSEADHSAKRLEELKTLRSRFVSRRGELVELKAGADWLLSHPKDQNEKLLLRTKEQSDRAAAELESCIKQLTNIEAEISALTTPATAAA